MFTVGSVSFLNASPLVDGIEEDGRVRLISEVPSRLLETLLDRSASIALCPIIDYQTAPRELCVVPVGAIASEGTTLTVKVFSRRPIEGIGHVAVDGDSRTSVALLQVVLSELHGIRPRLTSFNHDPQLHEVADEVDALLLIGDKVVVTEPDPRQFPYQFDLGEAWRQITDLPFVFATWMAPLGAELDELPELLHRRRVQNRPRIRDIVARRAWETGWSEQLAEFYLGSLLRYEIGQRELEAMTVFWEHCRRRGLIDELRPLRIYPGC